MKRFFSLFLLIVFCVSLLSACGDDVSEDKGSASSLPEIEELQEYISSAGKKTAEAKSLSFEVTGFGTNSSNDMVYMLKTEFNAVELDTENAVYQIKSGRQNENENSMTMKSTMVIGSSFNQAKSYYDIPINLSQHKDLSLYINENTEIASVDNMTCITCMMSFGDFSFLTVDDCESSNISKPVVVRFYVDDKGYLSEFQFDMAVNPDGSGNIYTSTFKYSDFNKASLDKDFAPESEVIIESSVPEGKENSSLTRDMLKAYNNGPSYSTEDFMKYQGMIAGGGNFGTTVAINNKGTAFIEEYNVAEDILNEVKSWKDIKYIDSSTVINGVVAVKNDGSLVKAGFKHDKYSNWDLSVFSDVKTVSVGEDTLFALKNDGSVIATGVKSDKVSGWNNVKQLDVYDSNIIAVKNDGTVYVSGDYDIETASSWTDITYVSAGRFHVVGLKKDGTVVTAGVNPLENSYDELNVSGWTDIIGVAAGNMTTVGVKSDGSVVSTGYKCDYLNDWTGVVFVNLDDNQKTGLRPDGRIYGLTEWDLF